MDTNVLEITLTASTDRYSEDDDRWLAQVADLNHQLRSETGAGVSRAAAVPGMKGAIDECILALGSSGAFTATIEMLRVWLARDKTRRVDASWIGEDGKEHKVTMSADGADTATLAPLVQAVAARIGSTI